MKISLNSDRKNAAKYILLVLYMVVFSLLRIYRNSILYNSSQQGGIWNIMAAFLVFFGAFSIIRDRYIKKGVFATLLLYSVFVWAHELVLMNGFSINNLYYLIIAPYFVFVLYLFFRYYHKSQTSILWIMRISFLIVFILLVYSFISFRNGTLEDLLLADVYYLLCLLPMLILYEKRGVIKIAAIIATGLLIVLSEKRAALIGFAIFVFFFYVLGDNSHNLKVRIRRTIALIVVIAASVWGYQYIYRTVGSRLIFRMSMLVDTGGAGRTRIYAAIWKAFLNSNVFEMICGHGRGSIGLIPEVNHTSAHSDFLHILYVYGIIPFLLLCVFYIQLFFLWFEMRRKKYPQANLYVGGVFICFMLSLFSTFCSSFGYVTCGAAFLGVILGDWRDYKLSMTENTSNRKANGKEML